MKWNATIKCLDEEKGILQFSEQDSEMEVPLKFLPMNCRVGDVLQVTINLDFFATLRNA